MVQRTKIGHRRGGAGFGRPTQGMLMKGVVFNLLETVVSDEHGEETWDELLDSTDLSGAYTAVGTYPNEELTALVQVAAQKLDLTKEQVESWFGRSAFPLLAARYPGFFEGHPDARSFMLTLNEVIHPEVRKLFPGAYAPSFEFDASVPDELGLTYNSNRGLCSFAEGLAMGAADHFGQRVTIHHERCEKRGDPSCTLRVKFVR